MPTLDKRQRSGPRWKGVVMVKGTRREQRFPDDTRTSKKQALIWEEETRALLLQQHREGNKHQQRTPMASSPEPVQADGVTLLDWANPYLNFAKDRFAKKTYKEKQESFKRLINSFGHDCWVCSISTSAANSFMSDLHKELSGHAVNKVLKNIKAAWTWGQKFVEGFPVTNNPFSAVPKFAEQRKDRYVPPLEDFYKVLEQVQGQDRSLLLALFYTAARKNEVFNLKVDDVDFQNNRIRLWTKKRQDGSREFDWIPMISELARVLSGWLEDRPFDSEFVFLNTTKQSVGFMKPFVDRSPFMRRTCDLAGVKRFGFHAIRHLTASKLYRDGQPVSLIQQVLRHKNPNTTARYLRSLGHEECREGLEASLRLPT